MNMIQNFTKDRWAWFVTFERASGLEKSWYGLMRISGIRILYFLYPKFFPKDLFIIPY